MLFLVSTESKPRKFEKSLPIRLWIGLLTILCVFTLFGAAAATHNPTSHVPPLDGQFEYAAIMNNLPALRSIWTSHQGSPAQIADVRSHLNGALRAAACAQNLEEARLLLQWGADPTVPSPAHQTAIKIAQYDHNAALIAMLKDRPHPE